MMERIHNIQIQSSSIEIICSEIIEYFQNHSSTPELDFLLPFSISENWVFSPSTIARSLPHIILYCQIDQLRNQVKYDWQKDVAFGEDIKYPEDVLECIETISGYTDVGGIVESMEMTEKKEIIVERVKVSEQMSISFKKYLVEWIDKIKEYTKQFSLIIAIYKDNMMGIKYYERNIVKKSIDLSTRNQMIELKVKRARYLLEEISHNTKRNPYEIEIGEIERNYSGGVGKLDEILKQRFEIDSVIERITECTLNVVVPHINEEYIQETEQMTGKMITLEKTLKELMKDYHNINTN